MSVLELKLKLIEEDIDRMTEDICEKARKHGITIESPEQKRVLEIAKTEFKLYLLKGEIDKETIPLIKEKMEMHELKIKIRSAPCPKATTFLQDFREAIAGYDKKENIAGWLKKVNEHYTRILAKYGEYRSKEEEGLTDRDVLLLALGEICEHGDINLMADAYTISRLKGMITQKDKA